MCTVSMVMDHGRKTWGDPFVPTRQDIYTWPHNVPTRQEFDELKKAVEAAKLVDAATGQPDCELDEKAVWFTRLERRVEDIEARLEELGSITVSNPSVFEPTPLPTDRGHIRTGDEYFRKVGNGCTYIRDEAHVYTRDEFEDWFEASGTRFEFLERGPEKKLNLEAFRSTMTEAILLINRFDDVIPAAHLIADKLALWREDITKALK